MDKIYKNKLDTMKFKHNEADYEVTYWRLSNTGLKNMSNEHLKAIIIGTKHVKSYFLFELHL